jgi:hypothetical protein
MKPLTVFLNKYVVAEVTEQDKHALRPLVALVPKHPTQKARASQPHLILN